MTAAATGPTVGWRPISGVIVPVAAGGEASTPARSRNTTSPFFDRNHKPLIWNCLMLLIMIRRASPAMSFCSFLPVLLALSTAAAGAEDGARLWPITLDGTQGYIDQDGRVVIAPHFSFAWGFSEGLASAWVDGSAGFISEAGKFVIPPHFEYARAFSEGLAEVEVADHWGCAT